MEGRQKKFKTSELVIGYSLSVSVLEFKLLTKIGGKYGLVARYVSRVIV